MALSADVALIAHVALSADGALIATPAGAKLPTLGTSPSVIG